MSVYISGPMAGYFDLNRSAFHQAETWIRDYRPHAGIINPAAMDLGPEADWADYMRRHVVSIATEVSTVVTLPGWQESRGARLEVHLAHALGIPVLPLAAYLGRAS